jgi:exoribonuclease R
MKSAKYVPASNTSSSHYGLKSDVYCHATSPIRRFADIINQFVLKGDLVPTHDIETLNERATELKKYERDMFFLQQLEKSTTRYVVGITLNDHRVWVPDWNRIVTCKNIFQEGATGKLYFSLDMNQPTWKKRMVCRFDNTGFIG